MRAYVAVTDQEWFEFLSLRRDLGEVNFWTPEPRRGTFQAINRGELFLFKLKSPLNVIAGGGFFEHFTRLPVLQPSESHAQLALHPGGTCVQPD